jgi:hypothetical protein
VVHVGGQEFLPIRLPKKGTELGVVHSGSVNAKGRGRLSRSFIGGAKLQLIEGVFELPTNLAIEVACRCGLRRHRDREIESSDTGCADSGSGERTQDESP